MKRTCLICEKKHKARGFCSAHYQNIKTTGSPFGKTGRRRRNTIKDMLDIIDGIIPNENGCKLWTMGINSAGYGHFSIKDKSYNVSRLLYITLTPGEYQGLVVRHKCDNRACCNIDHLEIGTQRDNILDIKKRDRGLFGGDSKIPRGEVAGRSKLTNQQVLEIRKRYPKEDSVVLAKIYGVNMTTILAIVHRKTWKHI